MNLFEIIEAIKENRIRISDHADAEAQVDNLTFNDIIETVIEGEIIEEYHTDKPYPSCLIFGKTSKGDPVHSVWGCNEKNNWVVLITVYRPDQERWINWRKRRRKDDPI